MLEIDKNQLLESVYRDNMACKLGLTQVYAYHCHRCNYTWLPKDFDLNIMECFKEDPKWLNDYHSIFFREPPKSCARCKSKYWKFPFRYRKTKHIEDLDAPNDEVSSARYYALMRSNKEEEAEALRPDVYHSRHRYKPLKGHKKYLAYKKLHKLD